MRNTFVIAMMALLFAGGCEQGADVSLFDQIKLLGEEKTELRLQVEKLESENEELTERVETLTSLGREIRLEILGRVRSIGISKRSGLYDRDKDGAKETLVVYVRVVDDAGDAIKAVGSMEVQLWDLNAEREARLGEWLVRPEELKEKWASTVMTSYFRLTFDVGEMVKGKDEELTVKVTFTDYITGKVVRKQAVIQP